MIISLLKCDNEDKELILLGDLNCDVNKSPVDAHTSRRQFSSSLYQMVQLINEPTRVTESSASTIDLILIDLILSYTYRHFGSQFNVCRA